jgi:hypothetical protein
MTPLKMLLIDAIIGRGFPNDQVGADMARAGIALATHQIGGPAWQWNKTALKSMSLDDLDMVYVELLYRGGSNHPESSQTA